MALARHLFVLVVIGHVRERPDGEHVYFPRGPVLQDVVWADSDRIRTDDLLVGKIDEVHFVIIRYGPVFIAQVYLVGLIIVENTPVEKVAFEISGTRGNLFRDIDPANFLQVPSIQHDHILVFIA